MTKIKLFSVLFLILSIVSLVLGGWWIKTWWKQVKPGRGLVIKNHVSLQKVLQEMNFWSTANSLTINLVDQEQQYKLYDDLSVGIQADLLKRVKLDIWVGPNLELAKEGVPVTQRILAGIMYAQQRGKFERTQADGLINYLLSNDYDLFNL